MLFLKFQVALYKFILLMVMHSESRIELNFFMLFFAAVNIIFQVRGVERGKIMTTCIFTKLFVFITVKSNLLLWDSSQHIITLLNVFHHGDKIYFNLKLTVSLFAISFTTFNFLVLRHHPRSTLTIRSLIVKIRNMQSRESRKKKEMWSNMRNENVDRCEHF